MSSSVLASRQTIHKRRDQCSRNHEANYAYGPRRWPRKERRSRDDTSCKSNPSPAILLQIQSDGGLLQVQSDGGTRVAVSIGSFEVDVLTQTSVFEEDDGVLSCQIAGLRKAWQYEDLV